MIRRVLVAAMFVLACALPVFAQSAASSAKTSDNGYVYRMFGGYIRSSNANGVQLGVGAAGRPLDNKQLEVQGDLSYVRILHGNGFDISANLLYDLDAKVRDWNPFIGAGLAVAHGPGTTSPGLQLLAGAEKPSSGKYNFRGELRIGIFADFATWSFLGGVSF